MLIFDGQSKVDGIIVGNINLIAKAGKNARGSLKLSSKTNKPRANFLVVARSL